MFTSYPGDDLLGYTYDVFGLYADEQSRIRHVVADSAQTTTARVHERTYDVPSNVSVVPYDHSEVVLAKGESYTAFSKSLEAKLKLRVFAPGFFASTKNRFAADVRGSQHSLYAHLMDLTYAAMVSLQSGNFALTSDFADALDNPVLPAKSLFRDYGTHLVTGMLGRVRAAARLGPASEEVARARGRALEVDAVRGAVLAPAVDPARVVLAVGERAGEQAAEVAVAVDELAEQHRVAVAALAVDAADVADNVARRTRFFRR